MGMEIDEPRRDCEAGSINCLASLEGLGRNGGDLTGADADIADGIQVGGGVEDTDVGDDEVIGLGFEQGGHEQGAEQSHALYGSGSSTFGHFAVRAER